MKEKTQKNYFCDHCNKLYLRKNACENHELKCSRNPVNFRPCFQGCRFLTKEKVSIYAGFDNYATGDPVNTNRDFFFCKAKNIFLYTPQNEIKGNHEHTDENGNDFKNYPMPKSCEEFKNGFEF